MTEILDVTDFDPDYFCAECFIEREQRVRYTYLPNKTRNNDLVVKVCEYCDGKELIRLAEENASEE